LILISYITNSAAGCLYGLKALCDHGLTGKSLCDVTQATLVAVAAWWAFLSVADKDRIESVIKKATLYCYLPSSFEKVHSWWYTVESKLFNCVLSSRQHVLYQLQRILLQRSQSPYQSAFSWQSIVSSGRTFYTECYLRLFTMGIYMHCIVSMSMYRIFSVIVCKPLLWAAFYT